MQKATRDTYQVEPAGHVAVRTPSLSWSGGGIAASWAFVASVTGSYWPAAPPPVGFCSMPDNEKVPFMSGDHFRQKETIHLCNRRGQSARGWEGRTRADCAKVVWTLRAGMVDVLAILTAAARSVQWAPVLGQPER